MLKKLFIFVQMSVVLNFVGCATTSKITDLNNTISADNVRIARELFISGEKQVKSNQQKAIECFTKAIESNPNYAEAYNSRGSVYLDLKQNETALNDFCTAIKIDPKLADAYNNRGTVYYQKKMFNKAIRDYTKAIEINPQFADAYYNRGLAYIDTDKFKKAKKDLLGVLILNGENETMVSKCIASLNLIGRNTYPIVSLSEIPDYYIFVSVENSGENIWIPDHLHGIHLMNDSSVYTLPEFEHVYWQPNKKVPLIYKLDVSCLIIGKLITLGPVTIDGHTLPCQIEINGPYKK